MSPIERLCCIGSGGMGALEYEPAADIEDCELDDIRPEFIARDVAYLFESRSPEAVSRLKSLGGSADGSRPKIVCLVSGGFERLTPGTLARDDMTPWILKFAGPRDPCDELIEVKRRPSSTRWRTPLPAMAHSRRSLMSGFRKEFDPFMPFPTFRQLKNFDALLFLSERACRRRGGLLIRCLRRLTLDNASPRGMCRLK